MKLIFLTEFFPKNNKKKFTGGVEARTYFISSWAKKLGHEVTVISRSQQQIEATGKSFFTRVRFQLNAIKQAYGVPADLIEASNVVVYIPAFFLSKIKKIPAVAWVPDVLGAKWFTYFSPLAAIAGYFSEVISIHLPWTKIIAMSQSTKQKLVNAGISSEKILVVYGGVDIGNITRTDSKKFTRPTIFCAARLVNYKRVNDLLAALVSVKKIIPQVQLIVAGEGPENRRLKELTLALGLKKNTTWLGKLDHNQVIKLMKRSHLFCLPSIIEGFGLVTAETMAAGLPYVNSAIPATVEITQNGQGGLLYEPGNTDQLAKKIICLLSDKKLYFQKQLEGQRFAKRYDWSHIASQTLKIYQTIIMKDNLLK